MVPDREGVPGTAFIIAAYRELGAAKSPRLYDDPVTPLLLTDDDRRRAAEAVAILPPAPDMVRLRTRYFDDRLRERLAAGVRQVVLLGSGLDARPARLDGDGVRWIEVDTAATLTYKERALAAHGLHPAVAYVPGDYVREGLAPLFARGGLEPAAPVHVVWEGNTTYLSEGEIAGVLADLARSAPRASVSFDHMSREVIDRTTGEPELTAHMDHLAAMGALWRSGFTDVAPLARGAGLTVADARPVADLWHAHLPDAGPPPSLLRFYHVCTLAPAGAAR